MGRLNVLENEAAGLLDKLKSRRAEIEKEERSPTPEEREEMTQALDRLDELDAEIQHERRLADSVSHWSASQVEPPPASMASEDDGEGREEWRKFTSFGEQLRAVVQAGMPGGTIDPRLMEMRAATGLGEAVPSQGGFLVQPDFATELLNVTRETGLLVGKVRKIPVSATANGLKVNAVKETSRADGSRWGGIRAYWLDEAGDKTASKPKFRQVELSLKKLIGLVYANDELLQDAAALEEVIRQGFAEEFGFKLDDGIVNGSGAGQPLGILNSGALVSQAKETGQAATTIVAENIEKMYSRMDPRSLSKAEWYINQDTWPQLFQLHHKVGTGGVPVFVPNNGLSEAPYGTLLGRPIVPIEQCATLGTVGDIIFADLSQYVMIDKGGIQSASSIHVKFTNDETVFRFVYRVDGQPMLNSAITPFKGSATVSPFVALATRS